MGSSLTKQTFNDAVKAGDLDLVKKLCKKKCPWDDKAMYIAVERDDTLMFSFLYEKGGKLDGEMCRLALQRGNFHIMKCCIDNNLAWHPNYFNTAAFFGHLDIVMLFRSYGRPWDDIISMYAAHSGNLSLVKYCIENGCPWNHHLCYMAKDRGFDYILEYTKSLGCTCECH